MKAAADAEARGPAPTGDGFTLDELNSVASIQESGVSDTDPSVLTPDPSTPNADALAFLDQVNAV